MAMAIDTAAPPARRRLRNIKAAQGLQPRIKGQALRCVFYCRVSTEDQAENDNLAAQTRYLAARYAADFTGDSPDPMSLVVQINDDGISGTIPLAEREGGARLLEMARLGQFDVLILTKLDRLGRTARVLLDAHDELERLGVFIRSATEPFDTRPGPNQFVGKFLFQMLASLAEMERATFLWRSQQGKEKALALGEFIAGPVPFGFDVVNDRLALGVHQVVRADGTPTDFGAVTEADMARRLFTWAADGDTLWTIASRLNAAGVPSTRRYYSKRSGNYRLGATQKNSVGPAMWTAERIGRMLHETVYKGIRSVGVGTAQFEQVVGFELVSPELFDRVAVLLTRRASRQIADSDRRIFTLKGLVSCATGSCTRSWQTEVNSDRYFYYRCCLGRIAADAHRGVAICASRFIRAAELENIVWADIVERVYHSQDTLDEMRSQVRKANEAVSGEGREIFLAALQERLAELRSVRLELRDSKRRGAVNAAESDEDLLINLGQITDLEQDIAKYDGQDQTATDMEQGLLDAGALLVKVRAMLDELSGVPEAEQAAVRQEVIQKVVASVQIRQGDGRERQIWIRYRFAQEGAIFSGIQSTCSGRLESAKSVELISRLVLDTPRQRGPNLSQSSFIK